MNIPYFRDSYNPDIDDTQSNGGLLALLQAAMRRNQAAQADTADTANQNSLINNGFEQRDILTGLPSSQSDESLYRPIGPVSGASQSPSSMSDFRQVSRASIGLARDPTIVASEKPVHIPVAGDAPTNLLQPAQFLEFFARPPIWLPEDLAPLEEVPQGAAGGERAGMPFPRNLGKPDKPEDYPRCTYCRKQTTPDDYERDHAIPRSRGGNGSEDNLNPSCRHCNRQKGDMTPAEYYDWIREMRGKV